MSSLSAGAGSAATEWYFAGEQRLLVGASVVALALLLRWCLRRGGKKHALEAELAKRFASLRKEGTGFTVGPFRREQTDSAAEALVSAFWADPVMRALWPSDAEFGPGADVVFRSGLNSYGERVVTTQMDSGEVACCAVFCCGGLWAELKDLVFMTRHLPFATSLGSAVSVAWAYLNTLEPLCKSHRLQYTKGRPHLYLKYLGTAEAAQGKGVGGVLAREPIRIADELGVLCYLESSNPRNVPFYKRLGFVVNGTALFRGATITFMSREPQSQAAQ